MADAALGTGEVKLLLIGGGGREHALAWKFLQDDPELELIVAPGNPGIATLGRCIPVRADDIDGLLTVAAAERPDVTMVGPEAPLAAGVVDRFRSAGFAIFGPTRAAARIETSKRWAKQLMQRAGIPTAQASHHTTVESARRAVTFMGAPVVIKASGLAAGKGVVVAETMAEAERAITDMLDSGSLGEAGREVLVEEYMEGEEISIFAICDGARACMLRGAQDFKRLADGDHGPNTGGMGAFTPVSHDTPALQQFCHHTVVQPALAALRECGTPFTGLLYVGLMLTRTGPRVVEFNCRFGDPETEALLPLMRSSLLQPVVAVARGDSLADVPAPEWHSGASVTTVLASDGYPSTPRTGDPIEFTHADDNVFVFHAGTRLRTASTASERGSEPDSAGNPGVVTAGGRVLAITAVAATLSEAALRSREYAERIRFRGKQMRHDIAQREIGRLDTAASAAHGSGS